MHDTTAPGIPRPNRRRRRVVAAAATAAAMLLATACAPAGPAQEEGPVTLRISTWGNDIRTKITQQAIDAFQAANPDIKVTLENSQWNGYWDKLATNTAAKDSPDVIQMDESYIAAYGTRGTLADLDAMAAELPLKDMEPAILDTGKVKGKTVGVPIGITNLAIAVNVPLMEKAGVPIPDDKTWTWEDYQRIGTQLTEKLGPDAWGNGGEGLSTIDLGYWARQRGEEVFPAEGQEAMSKETVQSWFEYGKELIATKAAPPASVQVESLSGPLDATLLATNKMAMTGMWNTQITAFGTASGSELKLLRIPATESGKPHMVSKASMYWSISSQSTKQKQAAKLINFLMTDPAATKLLTSERGVPSLAAVRTEIAPYVDAQAKVALDYSDSLTSELVPPPQVTPAKASTWGADLHLVGTDVLFDRATPEEGAQRVLDLINGYE